MHKLLLRSFQIFTDPLYQTKLHLNEWHCLTQWISKTPEIFEIHWARKYRVNLTGLEGIVNTIVYKTEPIFTGLGHGKLFYSLTLSRDILSVKFKTRNVNHVWETRLLSTENNCFWNIRNLTKWEKAHHKWTRTMTHRLHAECFNP